MTDDTKTAAERARGLAVPIMTEARRLRESNDLQWASWHAAIVEGIQQAITDTENRMREESKALVAAAYQLMSPPNHDPILEYRFDERGTTYWLRCVCGWNINGNVLSVDGWADHLPHSPADAQATLEGHVAAAVRPIENALERHRTLLASGVTKIRKAVAGREWLMEGRGSYGWDDDNWHKEFSAAAKEILDALEPLGREATRFDNCPNGAAIAEAPSLPASQTELDSRVAAAVQKAREEWERDQPNTELLAARIVELEERCEQLEETAYERRFSKHGTGRVPRQDRR